MPKRNRRSRQWSSRFTVQALSSKEYGVMEYILIDTSKDAPNNVIGRYESWKTACKRAERLYRRYNLRIERLLFTSPK